MKENIEAVDPAEVLERLSRLPVSQWNMKAQDPSIRHMGPMAQDFHAAFGLGETDRYINSVDVDGVALAAIQGLHAENAELRARNAELEARVAAMEHLQERLADVERILREIGRQDI
ncbi:MAG: tail fiber domain-containing protein [Kiritimatiellae bacterium]|nr:tail fiber domain-containing protein [Kiritimatiellia bacterium]